MKRIIALILVAVMALLALTACGNTGDGDETTPADVTTTVKTDDTTKPTDVTTTPDADDTTVKPADETTKPADETTKPADETTKPADETTATAGAIEQVAYTYGGSALWFEISSDKEAYAAGEEISLKVKIINKTDLEQTGIAVAIATPAGISGGVDANFTIDSIAAGATAEKTVKFAVSAAASAADRDPIIVKEATSYYTDYSYIYRVGVGAEVKEFTVKATLAPNTYRSLKGGFDFGTPNKKGNVLEIDDIVITSNSNGAVIYSNDFSNAGDIERELSYIIFNLVSNPAPTDIREAWTIEEDNGNKYLKCTPAEDMYGYSVFYQNDNLCDYTLSFKFRHVDDSDVQLVYARAAAYKMCDPAIGGNSYAGYQWVIGGWNNEKTQIQQYRMKDAEGTATERPALGSPEYCTFESNKWLDLKIVVSADKIECISDGISYILLDKTAANFRVD